MTSGVQKCIPFVSLCPTQSCKNDIKINRGKKNKLFGLLSSLESIILFLHRQTTIYRVDGKTNSGTRKPTPSAAIRTRLRVGRRSTSGAAEESCVHIHTRIYIYRLHYNGIPTVETLIWLSFTVTKLIAIADRFTISCKIVCNFI